MQSSSIAGNLNSLSLGQAATLTPPSPPPLAAPPPPPPQNNNGNGTLLEMHLAAGEPQSKAWFLSSANQTRQSNRPLPLGRSCECQLCRPGGRPELQLDRPSGSYRCQLWLHRKRHEQCRHFLHAGKADARRGKYPPPIRAAAQPPGLPSSPVWIFVCLTLASSCSSLGQAGTSRYPTSIHLRSS